EAGNGGPTQHRGGTVASDPAIADRKPSTRPLGGRRGDTVSGLGYAVTCEYALHRKRALPSSTRLELPRAGSRSVADRGNGPAVRTRSRPPGGVPGSHDGGQREPQRRPAVWRAAAIRTGPDAGGFADGDLPGPAGGSGPVCADALQFTFAGHGLR